MIPVSNIYCTQSHVYLTVLFLVCPSPWDCSCIFFGFVSSSIWIPVVFFCKGMINRHHTRPFRTTALQSSRDVSSNPSAPPPPPGGVLPGVGVGTMLRLERDAWSITCVAPPTKKMSFRRFFCTNLRLEGPLPVYFSCTTFRHRHSATTSATLLILKYTTRGWTRRCSNYSVAKLQQFSCALSTATLSLKFENVALQGWI